MAGFTTELFMFESSNEFNEDPKLVTAALHLVLREKGVHSPAYYGSRAQKSDWESKEAHQAVINSESYKAIGAALGPCVGGKADIYHVDFSARPVALEQPVTELLLLSLKSPENRAGVVEILTKLSEMSDKMFVYGQIHEDENKYMVVCGWPSIEVNYASADRPEVKAALDTLWSLANRECFYHTELSQYTS